MHIKTKVSEDHSRSVTVLHAWNAVLFALPFIGMGVLLVLIGEGVVPIDDNSWRIPVSEATIIGFVFAVPGLAMLRHGIGGVFQERRAERHERLGEWWLADHPWHPERNSTGFVADAIRALGGAALIWLLVWGISDWRVYIGGIWWPMMGGLALFGAVSGMLAVRKLLQSFKFGISQLYYPRVPILLGEAAEIYLHSRWLASHPDAEVGMVLQCVQEEYVQTRRGGRRKTKIECRVCHTQVVEAANNGGERIALRIETPDESSLGTDLRSKPPRYWELIAKAKQPGVDYEARLLLPIYASRATSID
jgi:hypothetical protein